jgi:hypothetical protein
MPKTIIKINTYLAAIPNWLRIDNSITIPLPLKSAKELAKKLLDMQDDAEIEINFASGKQTLVEIKYEKK